METQKASNSQNNPKQKEQHWKYHNALLQTVLQSHGIQNGMGIGPKTDMKTVGVL
jgi:hypothetical protein